MVRESGGVLLVADKQGNGAGSKPGSGDAKTKGRGKKSKEPTAANRGQRPWKE